MSSKWARLGKPKTRWVVFGKIEEIGFFDGKKCGPFQKSSYGPMCTSRTDPSVTNQTIPQKKGGGGEPLGKYIIS